MKEQTDKSNTAGLCFHIAAIVFVVWKNNPGSEYIL